MAAILGAMCASATNSADNSMYEMRQQNSVLPFATNSLKSHQTLLIQGQNCVLQVLVIQIKAHKLMQAVNQRNMFMVAVTMQRLL